MQWYLVRTVAALTAIGALAGCQLFTGPLDRVEFTAERMVGETGDSPIAQVELLVVNHGSEPVIVPSCGERLLVAIEALGTRGWTELTPGLCQEAIFGAVVLEEGEGASSLLLLNMRGTFRFQLDVRSEDSPDPKRLTSPVVEVPA